MVGTVLSTAAAGDHSSSDGSCVGLCGVDHPIAARGICRETLVTSGSLILVDRLDSSCYTVFLVNRSEL